MIAARVARFCLPLVVAVAAVTLTGVPAHAAAKRGAPTTYRDGAFTAAATAPTADKPQSKLWYTAGAWWALRLSSGDNAVHIFELRTDHTWRDTGTVVDTRSNSTGDALWDGSRLYVASRGPDSEGLRVVRASYVSSSRSWQVDSGFPVQVASGAMESATIAKDGTGVLWVTFTQASRVYVAHSTGTDSSWGAPFIPNVADTSLTNDDISAVVSFNHKIGVFWSNQNTGTFDLAVHADGAADSSWTREVAEKGDHLSDDHMSIKSMTASSDGRLFVAVKTSRNDVTKNTSEPIIQLLTRSTSGAWRAVTYGTVGSGLTRPQLVLDEVDNKLFVFATAPEDGGSIYYKSTSMTSPSFGTGRGSLFMTWSGAKINNISTSKQPVSATTGLVAIAADSGAHIYYHAEMPIAGSAPAADTTAPSVPAGLTASATSATSATVSWKASTDNVGVAGYEVYRNGALVATTTATSWSDTGLSGNTSYGYAVDAFDVAGNRSARTATVSVTTPPAPPSAPAVTFRSASSAINATTSSLVLPVPSGVAAGDVMLASVAVRGAPTLSAPAGWQLVRLTSATTTMQLGTYVHVVTGTEPASYTWSFNSSKTAAGSMLDYSGVSTSAPVDVSSGQNNAASTTVTAPSVTTTTAGDMLVALYGRAGASTMTAPTSMTQRTQVATPDATYKATSLTADQLLGAAGATGDRVATATSSVETIGQLVALRPAG